MSLGLGELQTGQIDKKVRVASTSNIMCHMLNLFIYFNMKR